MKGKLSLLALWLLLGTLIALLTVVNPTHYVSTDSQYYLSMAGWLVGLNGDQYGHRATGWDSTFPVGYPLLIGVLARLTEISLLVASKWLNVLTIAVVMIVWQYRLGSRAIIWMATVLLLGGYVRLITYTWSEWIFIVVLLEWLWLAKQFQPPSYRLSIRLSVITMALFLLRYVGGYVVVAYGLRAAVYFWTAQNRITILQLGPVLVYGLISGGFMLGYFYVNSWLTGSPYGGERFVESGETVLAKVYVLSLAPLNELLLLRDHIPGEPAALVWLGLLLQLSLLAWLWRIIRLRRETIVPPSKLEKQLFSVWLWASVTYLMVLFTMRWFSPFSGPNARMMAPVTLPLLMGVALWVSRWPNLTLRRQVARWWVVFLLASWLQLLPQANLVGKVSGYFR